MDSAEQLIRANQVWVDAHKPIDEHLKICPVCDDLRGESRCAEIEPMFAKLDAANYHRNRAIENHRKKKNEKTT